MVSCIIQWAVLIYVTVVLACVRWNYDILGVPVMNDQPNLMKAKGCRNWQASTCYVCITKEISCFCQAEYLFHKLLVSNMTESASVWLVEKSVRQIVWRRISVVNMVFLNFNQCDGQLRFDFRNSHVWLRQTKCHWLLEVISITTWPSILSLLRAHAASVPPHPKVNCFALLAVCMWCLFVCESVM